MVIPELGDQLLMALSLAKHEDFVEVDSFCWKNNIKFSSKKERDSIVSLLSKYGLIIVSKPNLIALSSSGANYLKARINLSVDSSTQENNYMPVECFQKHKDQGVEPCFGVKTLANCFVNQLDSIIDNDSNNVCMVGIFAPWGRGKSYFFNKVKENIIERSKNKSSIYYDIVEFNAWKFQETPALWAYLFETMFKSKGCWFKFWFTLSRNRTIIAFDVLKFLLPIFLVWIVVEDILCKYLIAYLIASGFGLSWIFTRILKYSSSALSFIKKYSKNVSFANELGVQAEIEKELAALLQFWVKEKDCCGDSTRKKVILYVDDIDRCSEIKMISIIDSLRTVLENEEIRKRLIIICSIDADKIKKGVKYKYKELYDGPKLEEIAVEQLDKIFLTGISLPSLGLSQLEEYVRKLAEETPNSIAPSYQVDNSPSISTHKKYYNSLFNVQKIDPEIIYELLMETMKSHSEPITPRKLRVIYYRILLANNIMSNNSPTDSFSKKVVAEIYNRSCGIYSYEESTEIVEMVVPYKS